MTREDKISILGMMDMARYETQIVYNEIRRAHVYLRDKRVGILEKIHAQKFSFRYSQAYLNERSSLAISKTLALQEQDYEWSSLHPFFDNLILEGWLLHQAEKILH
ncbi:MAG: HipA N-terminal domain-containing protein, partial [Oligoflexales bacterium]|nr:HipA N-terminal domain-containing protein [Oligoflexales bacterium]